MNDSFEMETCLATPNIIIANEEAEWKHFFEISNQDADESAWVVDE